MKKALLLYRVALLGCPTGYDPAAGQSTPARTQAAERALLDQYCVGCHNDKLRTANLSLQNLDLSAAGDHAELWEKVVRKLRAGLMPPPGVRSPPLAEYEGPRGYLPTWGPTGFPMGPARRATRETGWIEIS